MINRDDRQLLSVNGSNSTNINFSSNSIIDNLFNGLYVYVSANIIVQSIFFLVKQTLSDIKI